MVFVEHLAHHEALLARRDRLDALLADQASDGAWATTVARLRCLRGVDTLTAAGLVAEIGDITAFAHPRLLTSYLGLVPSEHSTGTTRRQRGPQPEQRRLLVERVLEREWTLTKAAAAASAAATLPMKRRYSGSRPMRQVVLRPLEWTDIQEEPLGTTGFDVVVLAGGGCESRSRAAS